jgi:HSP20 family molecular chaperone IbpA
MINDINMRETQRINNSVLIPGQVVDRGRAQQRRAPQGPRRIAPQQEMAPQQAPRMAQPQQAEAQQRYQQQQWQRQQWEEQQRQQEYERQQQEQEFYSQQQMYYGQQQGKDSLPDSIQRFPVPYGEPYSEMALANGKYHFWLDLPGVNPEDISVSYVNMELWISGKRQLKSLAMMPKTRSRGNKGKRPEFDAQITIPQFVENFDYRFPFPRPVDQDSIESDLSQGILHVEMTILDAGAPAGVQIKVGKK